MSEPAEIEYAYPKSQPPIYLAYGFRPMFLVLPGYMILTMLLWGLFWTGHLNLLFMKDLVSWHVYELLFGIGSAGIMAFMLTAVPEFFPGEMPIVGKPLAGIMILWGFGRVSFWLMDFIGVWFVAFTNIAFMVLVILIVFRPIIFDPRKRHYSFVIVFLALMGIQIWFFLAVAGIGDFYTIKILRVAVGLYMVLILLALRRINMEIINQIIADNHYDAVYISRPFRYNLSIFTILLFTILEFVFPENNVLGWVGLAAASAILGILNDYILDEKRILLKRSVWHMIILYLFMAAGYASIGIDYLLPDFYGTNHFRHFLTTGTFTLAFYMVMIIVSHIHTGRELSKSYMISIDILLIIASTFCRTLVPFFPAAFTYHLYALAAILWVLPFIHYYKRHFTFLISPRADGLPG